jgi:hypothetical protein
MKKVIISLSILIVMTGLIPSVFASEYGILRPGGTHSDFEPNAALKSTSITDTLTWRSKSQPEVNFGFLNHGDSLLVWLDPPAPCTLIAIRMRNINFQGHPLIDIWDASHYDPKIHSLDSTDATGWWGSFDPITCPTCWIPGLSDHSPLRWSSMDPAHHFWGPFPFTFTSDHENAWIEIRAELGLQGRIFLDGDPMYISSPFYITAGWGFAAEYTWVRPFPCFKFYSAGPGPDGIHKGWFINSYYVWLELIVEYIVNTPPDISNMTHYSDTYDSGPFSITVNIEDQDADNDSLAGVSSARLFYSIAGITHSIGMTGPEEEGIFSAEIPQIAINDRVTYWVEAVDLAGASARSGSVTFSRLVPQNPECDILIIWDMWSSPVLDSFYADLFAAIEHLSGIGYEYELWNIYDHQGIDGSILNWGWNTIIVGGQSCDHTLPGRDDDDTLFVNWLESGTSENPHYLLYSDQDYFHAHWEYGHDWHGALGPGDFLYDYFGIAHAISDHRTSYQDTVAIGEGDFGGIRINFCPDALDPTYPLSNVRPDFIVETTEDAERIFHYNIHSDYGAGVRLDRGHYRTVYLPWQDFFAVDSLENGNLVPREGLVQAIEKILTWFGTKTHVQQTVSEPPIPDHCRLFQNYPNPFNVNTDIGYQIVDSRIPYPTILKIYNILGQEVKTLVDEVQETGIHTVRWDGKDEVGRDVGSGMYFYQLKVSDFVETKRMLLLK